MAQSNKINTRSACANDDPSVLVDSLIANDSALQKLITAIAEGVKKELHGYISSLECKLAESAAEIQQLKQKLMDRTDELEQYQRRNSLRIFGREELPGENTDEIVLEVAKKLRVPLSLNDIDRSHRVGRKEAGKKRPIIVKFISYRKRREMFAAKRQLKNTGTTIREDLTRQRLTIYREAVNLFSERNVWTADGSIVIKKGNDRLRVHTLADLEAIA